MQILDCTLRDGGYYTNWDFDENLADLYFKSMNNLPVEFIEIGYRSKAYPEYLGKYFYCPEFIIENARTLAPQKKLAIMLNEKDTKTEDLPYLLNSCKGKIDLIRMAVDPKQFNRALVLSRHIKDMGFNVAINLMYMSKLTHDTSILNDLGKISDEIDFLNLVDSYGGVYPEQVKQIIQLCRNNTSVPLGYHGHNNMELAFANSMAAIEAGCTIVDSTITGMGRGAGNLRTELLLTWLVSTGKIDTDFNSLADVVTAFEVLKEQHGWGTNLPYMVSGANSLPQKDVMDWVSKRYYSINSIIQALENQKKGVKDNLKLELFKNSGNKNKRAIIIGGGPSGVEHFEAISRFISNNSEICIIHASSKNALPYSDLKIPQYFCLVGNEGRRFEKVISKVQTIPYQCVLPEYPRKMGTYVPAQALKNSYEIEKITFTDDFKDSHTSLAIQTAITLGVSELYIVGYDGYNNPSSTQREQELFIENNYLFNQASSHFKLMASITPTRYKFPNYLSVYNLLEEPIK